VIIKTKDATVVISPEMQKEFMSRLCELNDANH